MRHALLVLAVGFLIAADAAKDDAKKDQDKLQGTWKLASGEQEGEPIPEDTLKAGKLVVMGEKFTIKLGDFEGEGTQKLDATKKPKTIDAVGTGGQTSGMTYLGIYAIDGDSVKQCYAQPGDERPKEFTTKSGTGRFLFVWKKDSK
jgi:uncharacterized protein (TIGR03067 family)